MVLQNEAQRRHAQPSARPRAKITLSKEAHAAVTLKRRKKGQDFRDDLCTTWEQLDKATKQIASTHHKSVQRVQRDLYLGHGALCTRREKVNAWNAFCWKVGCENRAQC
jgi:hypothetical protein